MMRSGVTADETDWLMDFLLVSLKCGVSVSGQREAGAR